METLYTAPPSQLEAIKAHKPINTEANHNLLPTHRPSGSKKTQQKFTKNNMMNREHYRTVSLFNKKDLDKLFDGLRLANINGCEDEESQETQEREVYTEEPASATISDKMFCSFCLCPFDNRLQQKDHYRLDWHRFNLKQRILGKEPVSEEAFETITDDVSSISGSESSTSESDHEEDLSPTSAKKISFPRSSILANRQNNADTSDEESESKIRTDSKVMFRNLDDQMISIYRCLLHGKKNVPKESSELTSIAKGLTEHVQWLILMAGGGHFAGAVFHGETVVVHKTFHRYTVRAKRGTSQGLHDKQAGKNSKSVGANLRRYNETALIDDIHQILSSWEEDIKTCTHVFLRAPSHNRTIFFSGKNAPFDKNDVRIVNIPFATRRPTFKELKRVQEILSTVQVYEPGTKKQRSLTKKPALKKYVIEKAVSEEASPAAPDDSVPLGKKYQEPVPQEAKALADLDSDDDDDDEDVELVFEEVTTSTNHLKEFDVTKKKRRRRKPKMKVDDKNKQEMKDPVLKTLQYDIYTACKTGNNTFLEDLLKVQSSNCVLKSDQSNDDAQSDSLVVVDIVTILNEALDASKMTLLHAAAESGHRSIIWTLLKSGADPANRNSKGLPPFSVSKDKETRNVFRRYMASFPEQYDYVKAQIPSPLTPEMEQEKAAKNAEKKKAQKKIKKSKQKEQKEEQKKLDEEEEKRKWFTSLSDREKRAVAAERRMMSGSSSTSLRCWLCGNTIAGKPFSYMEFNFCSIDCLKKHKAK